MSRISLYIAAVFLMTCVRQANAGVETLDGRERGIWDAGGVCLIVARVTDVRALNDPEDPATHVITLDPIFTVAGMFDPAAHGQIEARLVVSPNGVWVPTAPPKDSLVLAVIEHGTIRGDLNHPFLWVSADICLFMPDRLGLVTLHDLDDKRITETLERVRKARADAKAATRPADNKPPTEGK